MRNYWLHRISHESDVSYPLFSNGYLSLGWSLYAGTDILNDARKDDNCVSFEKTFASLSENRKVSRWCMWYFAQFKTGDIIVVPLFNGLFTICEVESPAVVISDIKNEFPEITDYRGRKVIWDEQSGLLQRKNDGVFIDIGFVIKVRELISEGASRKEYADGILAARMKMRQTNGDITDIAYRVDSALDAIKKNKPINFYENAIESVAATLLNEIRNLSSDQFEKLVKVYMEKIGSDFVYIPAKNEHGKKEEADADVVAMFNTLKLVVLIQVKKHEDITNEWGVAQIVKYKEQITDENSELRLDNECVVDSDYIYVTWVISTCDSFSNTAISDAEKYSVRLIAGTEIARMLVDVGLSNINVL